MTEVLFVRGEELSAFWEKLPGGAEVLLYTRDGEFLGRLFVRQFTLCNGPTLLKHSRLYADLACNS
jgi:hypothetical protein